MPLSLTDLENELVLARISQFLNQHARAITPEDLSAVMEGGLSCEYAYALLLFSMCGFDMDQPAHKMVFNTYFLPMVQKVDPALVENDGYMQLHFPTLTQGNWRYEMTSYAPCEAFVRDDLTLLPNGRLLPAIGFFDRKVCYPAVLQDGRIWMTVTPNEINTMRIPIANARGHVLTFGLGLGYFAYHASEKTDVLSLTVVDNDPNAIALFKTHLLPQFPQKNKIHTLCSDAFDYAEKHLAGYDYIFTDLWHDVEDGLPLYLRMKEYEKNAPNARFDYWIEKSLRCYLS